MRRRSGGIIGRLLVIQNGVEEHAELAEVLPAIAGVGGEQDDAALAHGDVDNGGLVFDFVSAFHEAAEDVVVAAGELHEDLFAIDARNGEERTVGPANGHGFFGVAVEDGVRGLQDLCLHDRAGRVELRRGAAGVDGASDAEFRREALASPRVMSTSALFDELAEFECAFEPHAAGDVFGGAIVSQILEFGGLGVGERFLLGS